jgi:hypothetical protein
LTLALALTEPHLTPVDPLAESGERAAHGPVHEPAHESGTSYIFGDASPFPYRCNFIEIIHHAVTCSVALLRAEQAIGQATARSRDSESRRAKERAVLLAMADASSRALGARATSERLLRTVSKLVADTQATVKQEISSIDAESVQDAAATNVAIVDATKSAYRAVEAFACKYDLPGTEVGLQLTLAERGYAAKVIVTTPYGVEASFDAPVDKTHRFSTVLLVSDLSAPIQILLPKNVGWFSKRVDLVPTDLGKLTLRAIACGPVRCILTVGKGAHAGPGYKIEIDADAEDPLKVQVRSVGENGAEGASVAFQIAAEDRGRLLTLAARLRTTGANLLSRRGPMTQAHFGGKSFGAVPPLQIATRLVKAIAPITRAIGRRSSNPNELVLRRNAGIWHRDEVYLPKAELLDLIATVEPHQGVFDPLELGAPITLRAPLRLPAHYDNVSDADIIEEVQTK